MPIHKLVATTLDFRDETRMCDSRYYSKCKASELREDIENVLSKKSKNHLNLIAALKAVIANIILNNLEVASLMTLIVNLLKIDNLEVRKYSLHFITHYAIMKPLEASKALPYIESFIAEKSASMRILAIQSVSLVALEEFTILAMRIVGDSLFDTDFTVRKSAAFAVARIYENDRDLVELTNLINDLNKLLYDSNQVVVSSALAALGYITDQNPSLCLTIDKAHSMTLITILPKINLWNQVYVLNAIMSYVPQTSEEALCMIEAIIPSLQHESSAIVLNAIKVILYFCNYVKSPEVIIPSLSMRLGSSLASLLDRPPEIQFLVLRNVILLLLEQKLIITVDVEWFFCQFDDPIYIKDPKLEIIYLLANEDNIGSVLRELEEHATEVDVAMARKAIRAFGNIAVKIESAAHACIEILCNLLSHGISYVVQELVGVLKNILRRYPGQFAYAINDITVHHAVIDEPEAKVALIWIVGQYFELIKSPNVILSSLVDNLSCEPTSVQCAILTMVVKCYLNHPHKLEDTLVKVLKWATEEANNPDTRDRGFFYWHLLTADNQADKDGTMHSISKAIVLNPNPKVFADNDNVDPTIIEELELSLGLLASIYLKPIQSVFRLSHPKKVPYSPALVIRRQSKLLVPHSDLISSLEKVVTPIIYTPLTSRGEVGETFFSEEPRHGSRSSNGSEFCATEKEQSHRPKGNITKKVSRKASMLLK